MEEGVHPVPSQALRLEVHLNLIRVGRNNTAQLGLATSKTCDEQDWFQMGGWGEGGQDFKGGDESHVKAVLPVAACHWVHLH